ncbi:MAG: hypothetical protein A2177_15300 [Spirochaetes bacterium RBG_13_68_11]|nr:MAG: hypothetical protein A2177_15300 [Spirochaetes bacterium RBG_13_68_11]
MAVDRVLQLLGALLAATLVRGLAALAVAFAVTVVVKKLSRESRHLQSGRRPLGVWATIGILAVCLCCIVPLLALTGAAQPVRFEADDPFFGTWINGECGLSDRALTPKTVVTADSRRLCCRHLQDREAYGVFLNTFEDAWVDRAGDRWYKSKGKFWM